MTSWVLTAVSAESDGTCESSCSSLEGVPVDGCLLDILEAIFAASDSAEEAFLTLRPSHCPLLQPLSDALRRLARNATSNRDFADAVAIAAQAEAASLAFDSCSVSPSSSSSSSSSSSAPSRCSPQAGVRGSLSARDPCEEPFQFLGDPASLTVCGLWGVYSFTFSKQSQDRSNAGPARRGESSGSKTLADEADSLLKCTAAFRRRAGSRGSASSLPLRVLMHCFGNARLRPPDGFIMRAAVVDGCNVAAIPRQQLEAMFANHQNCIPPWLLAARTRPGALGDLLALDMRRVRSCIRFLSDQGVPAVRVVLPDFVVDAAAACAAHLALAKTEEEARRVSDALASVQGRHKQKRRRRLQHRLSCLRVEKELHEQRVARFERGARPNGARQVVACNVSEVLALQEEGILVAAPDCFPEPVLLKPRLTRKSRFDEETQGERDTPTPDGGTEPRKVSASTNKTSSGQEGVVGALTSRPIKGISRSNDAAEERSGQAEDASEDRRYFLRRRRSYDDLLVLQLAARFDGFVISNDRFKDLLGICAFFDGVISRRIVGFSFTGRGEDPGSFRIHFFNSATSHGRADGTLETRPAERALRQKADALFEARA